MVESGLNPKNIHLIGFSLGAHVAGTASESLKDKNQLIGRITGWIRTEEVLLYLQVGMF